ncbi:MAG TPA: archease [Actinomycetes bacterium]|nr:archease [Actinomycetes bacterium]
MSRSASGHRAVAHTADARVQAWAPTRERCIAEAVLGTVETFLDTSGARATGRYRCQLAASTDEDLLVAVLDEVIYLLDTASAVPVDVEIDLLDGGVDVDFATVDAAAHRQTGSIPKGVSLHELSLAPGPRGWSCLVTLDV